MNKQETIELIQAVENINNQLQEQLYSEKYGMEPWVYLEIQTNVERTVVMFLGEYIWTSIHDQREWIEAGPSIQHESGICTDDITAGHYEPIEQYLRKEINKLVKSLSNIKL
jgi:hypothetical protein